jgi:hypothetical protein
MATIQGVYLALFGRPADPAGLAFFNGITGNGTNLAGISDLASQPEYLSRFSGQSQTQIVQTIYLSLFGRAGDPGGVAFFVSELTSGRQTINSIAINILDGAQGTDKSLVEKKLAASALFTAAIDTPVEAAAYNASTTKIGVDYLAAITQTSSTVTQADADAAVLLLTGGSASAALTTGTDTFTGTSAADAYTATDATLNSTDNVDGAAGSDRITVTTTNQTPASVAPTLTSLESMTVEGTGGLNLNFSNISGLNNVIYDAVGDLTATNVSAAPLFVFGSKSDGNTTDASFSMKTGQATLNLMLNGNNTTDSDIAGLRTGTATLINIESIGPQGSIPTGGSSTQVNSILFVGENASGAIFKITGDASTSIAGGFANSVVVDGSGHRGDLYVNGSNGGDQLKGGSGTNTFNGLDGFDIIDLSQSAGKIDTVKLTTAKTFADRDLVIGFQAGAGGDKIELRDSDTTHSNTGNASLAVFTSLPATGNLNVDNVDVFEFTTQINSPLSVENAGANLFSQVGYGLESALGTKAYFVAYGTSNTAALFYFENTSTTTISEGDVQLVGVFSNVSLGAFDASNFSFI